MTKVVGRRGFSDFLYVRIQTESMGRRSGSGGPSKRTDKSRETIESTMRAYNVPAMNASSRTLHEKKNRLIHMLKGLLQNL